jgi:hypothetical protein
MNGDAITGVLLSLFVIAGIAIITSSIMSPRVEYLSFEIPDELSRLGTESFRFPLNRGWNLEFEIDKTEEAESCLYFLDMEVASKNYFFLRSQDPEPWYDPRKIISAYPKRAPVELTENRDDVVYGYSKQLVPQADCSKTFEIVDGKKITFEIYAETYVEGVNGLRVIKTPTADLLVLAITFSTIIAALAAALMLEFFGVY